MYCSARRCVLPAWSKSNGAVYWLRPACRVSTRCLKRCSIHARPTAYAMICRSYSPAWWQAWCATAMAPKRWRTGVTIRWHSSRQLFGPWFFLAPVVRSSVGSCLIWRRQPWSRCWAISFGISLSSVIRHLSRNWGG